MERREVCQALAGTARGQGINRFFREQSFVGRRHGGLGLDLGRRALRSSVRLVRNADFMDALRTLMDFFAIAPPLCRVVFGENVRLAAVGTTALKQSQAAVGSGC